MTTKEQVVAHTSGLVVLRDLDHGRGSQFWLLDMRAPEFEAWWQTRESLDTMSGSPDEHILYEIYKETPPPPRQPVEIPGRVLDVETRDDLALWSSMSQSGRHYRCNLCCDADSYLTTPDGRKILHKGHPPEKPPTEK